MESNIEDNNMATNNEIGAHQKLFEFATIITHVLIIGFVLSVMYLCLTNELVLFTWHPLLLASGWVLLMTEGILMLASHNPLSKRLALSHKLKVQYHWVIQAIGVSCSIIGFIVIYINKNLKDKPHFHSWHGISGLISIICCVPACVSGTIALYSFSFKSYVTPANNKFIHRSCGLATFAVGSTTVLLSLYTMWFKRNVSELIIVVWFIIILFTSVWSISQTVIKVFSRFKSISF